MVHKSFTTTTRGLQRNTLPMRLFEKSKRFGIWNPSDIDFSQDIEDWRSLSDEERDVFLRLTSMFLAGEEAVTIDLLPLIQLITVEGRLEEEIFLTSFLWEEAKHTDFFRRFLDEVAQYAGDLSSYHSESYMKIFYSALPDAMHALRTDPSPQAQVRAAVTYNIIVEGTLAETGYHAYHTLLDRNNIMPGMREGMRHLQNDESRHLAYGIFLISRLIVEHRSLWDVVEETMTKLLPTSVGIIGEIFAAYDPMPFGLEAEDFINYATDQFQKRYDRLERARTAEIETIYGNATGGWDGEDE